MQCSRRFAASSSPVSFSAPSLLCSCSRLWLVVCAFLFSIFYSWSDLESMIELMQAGGVGGGGGDSSVLLPLQSATISSIVAQPLEGASPQQLQLQLQLPTMRVLIMSPHDGAPATPAVAALSSATATSAPAAASAAASSLLQFHPLFDFASAVLGSDLAALLNVPAEELRRIRWR